MEKTKSPEKTKEMEKYEKETGKKAIWLNRITDGFNKWKKGEKVYTKSKERINILVSEEKKNKWQEFVEKNKIGTISKLVRRSVDYYIDSIPNLKKMNNFSNISHNLREELSSIKGFSQILIQEYKDELSWDLLLKIKEIFDKSVNLENLLNKILDETEVKMDDYDILVIDDDKSTIYLISEFFKKKGITIKATGLGQEALNLIQKNTPKLILLDILLPDEDGYEICKLIKSNNQLKSIPIFYITAVPEAEVKEKLKITGADGYFLKPFDMSQFNLVMNYL
jgi:CheY-like chemotaxis protein